MSKVTFACNGASVRGRRNVVRLDYQGNVEHRVRLGLPRFVDDQLHLPDHVLDLLEIAAYVYAADRSALRGRLDAVEYNSWARDMEFHIRVREEEFWQESRLKTLLSDALNWMTGDRAYAFSFQGVHSTPPSNLFDAAQVAFPADGREPAIMPFSGGLDSLAGALALLVRSDAPVILISHRSSPRTMRTQDALVEQLRKKFPGRLVHYAFACTLSGVRGKEETQRSRSFLYTAIAASIAVTRGASRIYVFENGVTSLNLSRRQDLMNARSSRTTHPQTLGRLAEFFSEFAGREFMVEAPFLWKTKAEVIDIVAAHGPELISSTVSCTAAFTHLGQSTHCGECFQCIDRRLAAYASGHADRDHSGLYSVDVTREAFTSGASKTTAIDYLRQAAFFQRSDANELEATYTKDLGDVLDWMPGVPGDLECIERVHSLLARHGGQVREGLVMIRDEIEDPFSELVPGSLLKVIADREHLRPEVERLATRIADILQEALPRMFRKDRPKDEPDLNAKINGLLATHEEDLRSEHPIARFACATVIPDHDTGTPDLVVEAKYLRKGTPPSKASEGISADVTKYPPDAFILFVVLDLDNSIPDDREFKRHIEGSRQCRVLLIH